MTNIWPPDSLIILFLINMAGLLAILYKRMLGRVDRDRDRLPSLPVGYTSERLQLAGLKEQVVAQDIVSSDSVIPARICVQLPVYNEKSHVVGLLDSIVQLQWPRESLEIQILDDSTDITSELIKKKLAEIRLMHPELSVQYIHRLNRDGYKAGALNNGMQQTDAEFIAVFDCDFRPQSDFLLSAMPYFDDDKEIAAVQAPWGFTNADENALTKIEALLLNCHFHLEHRGRSRRNLLFNFNGTAGIWRHSAVTELGGWSAHSVTEDLYLSLKAWLRGKRIVYADIEPCPSELPNDFKSFLIQQRRWAKGNGQVVRLLSREIFKSSLLNVRQKVDVLWHLFGYALTSVLLLGFLLTPYWLYELSLWFEATSALDVGRLVGSVGFLALCLAFYNLFSHQNVWYDKRSKFREKLEYISLLFIMFPFFSTFIARSFWQGLFAQAGSKKHLVFDRTPKVSYVTSLQGKDLIGVSVLASLSLVSAILAVKWELYVAALPLVVQGYFGFQGISGRSRKETYCDPNTDYIRI